jgi:hypothetical protein
MPAAAAALSCAPQLWQHLHAQQQPQQQQQLQLCTPLLPQQILMFCRPLGQLWQQQQQQSQCQQQQQQQQCGLLGVAKAKNYQDHNQKKPKKKYKLKTPP